MILLYSGSLFFWQPKKKSLSLLLFLFLIFVVTTTASANIDVANNDEYVGKNILSSRSNNNDDISNRRIKEKKNIIERRGGEQSHRRPSLYPVDEHIFNATVDHYNFEPTTLATFPLYYYVNEGYYRTGTDKKKSKSNGNMTTIKYNNNNNDTGEEQPTAVFFYTGNEGDIFQFINNSGFLFESAKEFGAMVVFAEHRYYGLSNPFGDEYSLGKGYNISFLTVEQAMQDYNTLTVHIRKKWNLQNNVPFIAFGGSYGANLALWLRLKNPNIWAGAIASSATPLKHLLRETNGFTKIETEVYGNVSSLCPDLVREGWKDLYDKAKTNSGRKQIAKDLSLCSIPNNDGVANIIHGWLSDALETMVQYGYPYETSFFNPLPSYPFKKACLDMIEANTGLGALKAAANVYYNYTGQAGQCFSFDNHIVKEAIKYWGRKHKKQQHGTTPKAISDHDDDDKNKIISKNKEQLASQYLLRHRHLQPDEETENNRNIQQEVDVEQSHTDVAWGYQTCTEVYQPMPTNGITDLEVPYEPNQESYFEGCYNRWGVVPRPNWEEMTFMGDNIFNMASNIFLTSGQLDPWRAAGIQSVPSSYDGNSITVRIIENGAHHLDLRASHPLDPPSVIKVRNEEKNEILNWIAQWGEGI